MHILFITLRFPYPPLKGDQVLPYYRLKYLSKRHKITLLSFYEHKEELDNLDKVSQYCQAIHLIKLSKWQSLISIAFGLFFSKLPLQVLYYKSNKFKRKLEQLLVANNFDLVHAYMLRSAQYLLEVDSPKILDLIDSMQLNLKRRLDVEPFPFKLLVKEELRRIVNYERKIANLVDRVFVVSEKDAALIPSDNIVVVPLGVDVNVFQPQEHSSKEPVIIFSGNMGYEPNINAVLWFVRSCWPIVCTKIHNVKFIIAGGNPTREIKKLAISDKKIVVTGPVKSMPDVINKALVAIAPMQSGSGMQFKILEAMSCAIPVVTTTLGFGDIKAKIGEEVFVADDIGSFSETVSNLLLDINLAKTVGKSARNFVINNHSWEKMVLRLECVYEELVEKKGKLSTKII